MIEVNIGDQIRIKPDMAPLYPDVDYTVVTITEHHVGLISENYDPEKQNSPVQIAVKKEYIKEIISPASNADISETPMPGFKDIRNF